LQQLHVVPPAGSMTTSSRGSAARFSLREARFFRLGLDLGGRRFQLLERQRQLVVVDALRFASEMRAADLGDDGFELLVASGELIALGNEFVALAHHDGLRRGVSDALGDEHRAQGNDVVRQHGLRGRHAVDIS
jgi:hypothetical protein